MVLTEHRNEKQNPCNAHPGVNRARARLTHGIFEVLSSLFAKFRNFTYFYASARFASISGCELWSLGDESCWALLLCVSYVV